MDSVLQLLRCRHKVKRKIWKKLRRKRIRSARAIERKRKIEEERNVVSTCASYHQHIEELESICLEEEREKKRISEEVNERWLREVAQAELKWNEMQKRMEAVRMERAKQEAMIREEWERQENKRKEESERKKREQERKQKEQEQMSEWIDRYVTGEVRELPEGLRVPTETNPGELPCPFFSRVAACRFRDMCSRNHIRPSVSSTLLLPGFFTHFGMEQRDRRNEYDTDVALEFDDSDIYQHFLEFYEDVLPELRNFGEVIQLKVCRNEEPHLRGNVYVQYRRDREAMLAMRSLHGRFYGGKQISAMFCNVPSWKEAICGLFYSKRCPKGRNCNFMHVFQNPNKEFSAADKDKHLKITSPKIRSERSDWAWSPSPERIASTRQISGRNSRTSEWNNAERALDRMCDKSVHSERKKYTSDRRKSRRSGRRRSRSKDNNYSERDRKRSATKSYSKEDYSEPEEKEYTYESYSKGNNSERNKNRSTNRSDLKRNDNYSESRSRSRSKENNYSTRERRRSTRESNSKNSQSKRKHSTDESHSKENHSERKKKCSSKK